MMNEKINDDNSDQIASAIEAVWPKSLDDIIRKNRESLQIRMAIELDILSLKTELNANNPLDIFDNWSLIAIASKEQTFLRLIGEVRSTKDTKITSNVIAIDMKQQVLKTLSGSFYQLGTPNEGEPDIYQLYFICAYFHQIGIGPAFGVPHFYY